MSDQMSNPRASWLYLPPELRRMILAELFRLSYKRKEGNSPQERTYKRSAYAAVSREWQLYFESSSFEVFTLHQSDLEDFDRIVQGHRRAEVKFIWLRMELPEYGCEKCAWREWPDEVRANERLFTNAVWNLFSILSSWGGERDGNVGRMTLQLSVHSPSDALHYCQELKSRINYTGYPHLNGGMKPGKKLKKEASHGWLRGRQVRSPSDGAKLRVFGHPRGLGFDLRTSWARRLRFLPKVKIVNKLLICRQFYRHFSVPKALKPMIESLPQLEVFEYEPWRGINTQGVPGQEIRDMEHTRLLQKVFLRHKYLRSITMFESFDGVMHGKGKRNPCPALGRSLAKASLNLDEVFAALNVDANDFFYAFSPGQDPKLAQSMSWNKMEYICLSSQLLNPAHYDELIQVAAAAALKMPKLRCMELWDSGTHSSCIFRYFYCRKERVRHLQLLSTWNGKLSEHSISRWREVANSVGEYLDVKAYYLDYKVFDSYTAVIQYLFLRRALLTDFSLRQIVYQK